VARKELVNEGSTLPGVLDAFREWGQKRNPPVRNLGNLHGAALRGAIKKLEKLVEEGKQRAAEQGDAPPPEPAEQPTPEPEEPDVAAAEETPPPAEPPAETGDAHAEPGGS
jgi:DNA-binding transcriptional MocR family regulator